MQPLVSAINKNFLIRYKFSHQKTTHLIGAGQYKKLVGEELENKHFLRVLNSLKDRTTIKLRRGLRIDFISK